MLRLASLVAAVALIAAPAAAQDQVSVTRDGDRVVIALPDGETKTVTLDADRAVKIVVRDGEVVIEQHPQDRRSAWNRQPLSGAGDYWREDIEVRLEEVFDQLPGEFRERVRDLRLPRVRIEQDVEPALRREIADVERQSRRLALELRRAERDGDAAEAESLRRQLRSTLDQAFNAHQEARRQRAQALRERQERLAADARELDEEIALRNERRAEIVERRMRQLVGDSDDLDW